MKSDININNKDCLLNWKEFEISRLFTIKSPAARTIKSYSEGKTPYVSSGSFNNGIVSYLEPMADEKIEKGQCITVSPLDGSAFFQEEDFLGSLNGYRQIKYLLDHIGYEATYCFINNEVFAKKDEWMAFIWECMPEETIDEKIINDYKTFVFNNLAKDKPIVPAVQVVARYCERDSKLKAVVIKAVLTNPQMSANFLSYVYDDVAVEGIINFFENDIIALASIYMSAIENNCHIDYDGKLFKRIFEQHPTVWNEYVDWIKSKDTMCGDGNEHKIIELIWGDDKWRECVEYAFKVLIDDDVIFHIKEPADMLFTNTTDETILERKKYWLIEKLRETSLELKKCKKLIEMVVNVLPDWKLEYILEFLKINKNPEDFKEIPLFPSSYSWSGSEIPLIMEKIDFLKSLKDNIKGINFIEHRKYIEEYRMNLERYKDNVELREYLENADYA